jgi:ribosomal protein S18 acetylase RimI-like enzyme
MVMDLPSGHILRPATRHDLDPVVELMVASDVSEYGAPDTDRSDVLASWGRPGFELATDTWAIEDPRGGLAAYAEAFDRGRYVASLGVVRPDLRGRGLGSILIGLIGDRARQLVSAQRPSVAVRNLVSSVNVRGGALLQAHGFAAIRVDRRMTIELGDDPPDPRWPDGIAVRPFDRARDERPVHRLVQDAFLDIGDFVPSTFEAWSAFMMGSGGFDALLWFVAGDGTELAGVVLCFRFPETGWIRQLAVARPFRGRGLGLALLRHAFGELRRRGCREAGLVVDADNRAGATRLYDRAGMRVAREYLTYERVVRAGG